MKKRKTLVRAVALFMVGLITSLALVIPTSAIISQYVDDRNNPSPDCPVPFDVRFWYEHTADDESLYFGYDVPIGYGSLEQNYISGGLDSAEGRKFNDNTLALENESFRANYSVGAPTYINHMTAWGNTIDWWGYIPVELDARAVGRDNFDGIAIDAPTFYYNVWESTFYQDTTEGTKLFSMPTIQLPVLDDGKVYVGRYSVSCGIYDTNGEFKNVEYSIAIDQRIDNDPIPFLNSGVFEQYLTKTEDDLVNNYIVAIDGFQAFIDVDVYEYVEPTPINPLVGTWLFKSYFGGVTQDASITTSSSLNYTIGSITTKNGTVYNLRTGTGITQDGVQIYVGLYFNSGGPLFYGNKSSGYSATMQFSELGGATLVLNENIYNNDVIISDNFLSFLESKAVKQSGVTSQTDSGTWELVENSTDKCTRLIVTYPIHKMVGASIGGGGSDIDIMNRYSYPDWDKYEKSRSHKVGTDIDVDFTGWIATATSGFLNFELLPNFSIGGVLAILVGFSLVILFLKVFAGG